MKKVILVLALLLLLPAITAINLEVQKISQDETLIVDLGTPATFVLKITNNGADGNFEFYNLAGYYMSPDKVQINTGQTKEINLQLTPVGPVSSRGYFTIPYTIRATDKSEMQESLSFKIIELKDAFEVGSGDIDPETQTIEIYMTNLENINLGSVSAKFVSPFFNVDKTFPLGPRETQRFPVQLSKEDFKSVMAGFYTLTVDVSALGKETTTEGVIKFVEKDIVTTTKKDYGFLINTQIINKANEGNTVVHTETVIKKNLVSRLFTSFSPTPDIVERSGFTVYYTWSRDVLPGQALEIEVKTNWLFPLLLVLFIVAIVALVKKYTGTNLVLRKRVSFVRAKGGEFALKVSIMTQAKKHIERVNVVDRLPNLVSLHEKFFGDQPTRTDTKNRRIEWNFDSMQAGEIRIVSYLIYSKVGVFGKFELPTATAIFEREGEVHEVESNKAFFVTEQRKLED